MEREKHFYLVIYIPYLYENCCNVYANQIMRAVEFQGVAGEIILYSRVRNKRTGGNKHTGGILPPKE